MGRTRKVTGRSTPSKAESPQKPVRRGRRGRSSVEPESESNDRIEDEVDENLAKSESESNGDSDYESLATKKKRSSRSTKAKQPELPKRITRRRSSRRDDSDNESRETAEVLDSRNDSSEQMQTITEEQDEEKSKEIDVKPIEQESHGEIVVVQEAEDEQQMKQDKAVSEVSVQDNENDESKENAQEKEESEAKSPEKQDKVDDEPEKETPMECEQPENPVADQLPKGADECEPSNKENIDQKDDTDVVKPKNSHANDLKSQTHANEEPESLQIIENPKDPQEIEKPKSPPPAQYEKEDGEVVEEDVEAVENTKKREIEEKAEEKSPEKKPIEVKKPIQRKRRWLTNKPDSKPSVITISTDSLKNIIAEPVRPVPLSDVRLESSPEPEVQVIIDESPKEKRRSKDIKEKPKSVDKENIEEAKVKAMEKTMGATRKISIVSDDGLNNKIQRPPTPPKHHQSNILYITNLVRPFTVLQLKGLLARTGKIVENGFWIDKIKSKCYVKYENEDEAVETRHALHGVTWPPSNPKCLNVDFSNDQSMEKAIISTLDEHQRVPVETSRDNKDFGWSKENSVKNERDAVKEPQRIVREWDLGKKNDFDRDHENERRREKERVDRRDLSRDRKRDDRRRSNERGYSRERRRSATESPARKFKKEDEPPIRLLDDLFRKTKATPCIYWLPLTDEQIAEKEEMRRKSMAEHQRRMEERKKLDEEREKEREKRRERERERDRERERERRRSGSRGRRRSGSRGHSRDRDRRRHR